MLITQAIIVYLERKHLRYPRAARIYPVYLRRFTEFVGDRDLGEIGPDQLTQFQKKIQEEYTPANSAYHVKVLRNFFRFWNDRRVTNMPISELEPPKFTQEHYRAVTEEEFDMQCMYLETEPENFANIQKLLIVRFLFETGVRVGELCAIKWQQINPREAGTEVITEKNKIKDWIFWSQQTHELLLKFIELRRQYNGESLFVTYEGRMSHKAVQRFLKTLGITLGLDYPLSPHCYRHGKAMFMEKYGADLLDIQSTLRHKDPKSTLWYINMSKTRKEERAKKYLT